MSSSVATAADRTLDDAVLEVVASLVGDLGIEPPGGVVSTAHSLDRDLGLGSLERVELALRLEQALGVTFADEVMAVDFVADLARAARTAGARPPEALPVAAAVPARGVAAPASARTLTEVLAWHADRDPDRGHVWLHEDGRERRITARAPPGIDRRSCCGRRRDAAGQRPDRAARHGVQDAERQDPACGHARGPPDRSSRARAPVGDPTVAPSRPRRSRGARDGSRGPPRPSPTPPAWAPSSSSRSRSWPSSWS